jgi:biopolymer transport protein ExbB
MIKALFLQIYDLWLYGGLVMPALFGTAFVLWTALGNRILSVRRGDKRSLRDLVVAFQREPDAKTHGIVDEAARRGAVLWNRHEGTVPLPFLDEAFADLEQSLHSGTTLVRVLIAMSPLLGLLGTVTGLIETFGSLGESTTSTASEGIAGGIVEALYATQMGLAIAVPGLLMGGILHHREQNLAHDLEGLKAIFSGSLVREAA